MTAGTSLPEQRATLMSTLAERAARVDRDRVGACFDYAAAAHGSQKRVSGQPFISHAVEVCRILLDLLDARLDTTLACAALLHDVVEDTAVTPAEIEKHWGKEVASLVEGVTKLSSMHFDSAEAAQAENFRKMLLSMSKDLRVIFIKLADRLHNMRTIEFLRPDKVQRIAKETREIYAPLAHRLGMANIKRELEDLSLKVLDPEAYQELAGSIQAGGSGGSAPTITTATPEPTPSPDETNASGTPLGITSTEPTNTPEAVTSPEPKESPEAVTSPEPKETAKPAGSPEPKDSEGSGDD